jgi:hypothetical protein
VTYLHCRTIMPVAALCAALAFAAMPPGTSYADNNQDEVDRPTMQRGFDDSSGARNGKNDDIDRSVVQQGFDASPIPKEKLNFKGKNPFLVGLGSYLVNAAADCNGCHSFPRFLRPGGTVPGTNGNPTGNLTNQGSNPIYGDPYLDPPPQSVREQLKANHNIKHFLAGGRCFGGFQARNLTPDDSGRPRGLTEAEFIRVMRTGADVSCSKPNPPTYGGVPDGVCALPDPPGAGVTYNPNVLQTMSWPTYHSMTDTDLKAIYAYLSALSQTTACNTAADGCAGFSGLALAQGLKSGQYAYPNTDDCPNPPPPQ